MTAIRLGVVGIVGVAALLVGLLPQAAQAQGLEYVEANYTKYEYRIPMRDGKRLFTSVFAPKDQSKKYPILLTRTPYSCQPYGADSYRTNLGPSEFFAKAGYIFVYQDVRGRWMSEGDFVNMRPQLREHKKPSDIDESTDTWDTIDWLIKNVPGHNDRVGQWGISYPGFYTAAGMIDAHPHLKACSPQAPVTDWFIGDDWHHHGAFFLPHAFNFLANFGLPRPEPTRKSSDKFDHDTPDGYDFFLQLGSLGNADAKYFKGKVAFWNEVLAHGTYDDWWQARNIRAHLTDIRPAVMTVGGWYDAENLFGALEVYKRVEATSPGTENVLAMGPWSHGGWSRGDGKSLGPISFRAKTGEFYREKIEFPFFERHLKDVASKQPEAWVFETGTNIWREYDAWPPRQAQAKALYFQADGKLDWTAPTANEGVDAYVSDPAKPVPFQDKIDIGMTATYMVEDQRFASRRTDVLTYQTPPLEEDVTVVGSLSAKLFVSTSGTDSDWVVKLIDVYPNDYPEPPDPKPPLPKPLPPNVTTLRMGGYQQLVRGDVMRGKFRNSYEQPEPFKPGEPTAVNFELQDVLHTFRAGHRIMIQVHSSWFPLVDRNPQKFVDIYHAKESDFQTAEQRVFRTAKMPSRLELRTLGGK